MKNKKISGLIGILIVLTALSATIAEAVPFQKGNVFAGTGNGKIDVYYPNGTFIQTLETTSGSAEQTGMCFDASGNLYATSFSTNNMSKFNNTGGLITFPWGGPFNLHPESCIVDAAGNVYVGQADGSHKILKFDLNGNQLANYSPVVDRGTDWIDLAADQKTIFYASEGSSVRRFDVSTNTQLSDFATGLSAPCYALRIRPNGEVIVACASQVYRLNSSGGVIQTYTTASVGESSFFFAANLDPDGKSFWTGGYGTGHIYRFNISDGALLANFTAPPRVFSMAGLAIFGEITAGGGNPPAKCSGECKVVGLGLIGSKSDPEKKFEIFASTTFIPKGKVEVQDNVNNLLIKAINITSVVTNILATPKTGTITGFATINNAGSYAFTVDVIDAANPSHGLDVLKISIPGYGNYVNTGNVSIGDITIVK